MPEDVKKVETGDSTPEVDESTPKYTQSDFDKLFSQARKKWEKESQQKLSEAEKLAKMDEAQRNQAALENALKENEALKREKAIAANLKEATKVMAARNVPIEFTDFVVTEDDEKTLENIKLFERVLKQRDSEIANKFQKGTTPQAGSTIKEVNLDAFAKMTSEQRVRLAETNFKLWEELDTQYKQRFKK